MNRFQKFWFLFVDNFFVHQNLFFDASDAIFLENRENHVFMSGFPFIRNLLQDSAETNPCGIMRFQFQFE